MLEHSSGPPLRRASPPGLPDAGVAGSTAWVPDGLVGFSVPRSVPGAAALDAAPAPQVGAGARPDGGGRRCGDV